MIAHRISRFAQADIIDLLTWTESNFGEAARLRYEGLLRGALQDVTTDPWRINSIARPELGPDVRSYHLRHSRDRARTEHGVVLRPRHFLLYRCKHPALVGIGRVLHDAMEIERHVPHEFGDE